MPWRELVGPAGRFAGRARSERQIVALTIAWTWSVYLALISIRLAMIHFPREGALLGRTVLTAVAGALISWCVHLALRACGGLRTLPRIAAAMVLILPAAMALTLANYAALYVLAPTAIWSQRVLAGITLNGVIARTLPEMYFLLASWVALHSFVTSALESGEARRRTATLQAEMREAQLKALRYQLNPHFLFNALNSLSALVMRDDKEGAERVIQAISAFLRATLDERGTGDTTLDEELAVQRLYLEIEQVRFGDRLRVEWAVPEELGRAELPPLLLQPLVENVLRHAVAPVSHPVTMTVAAYAGSDGLHVCVEDDGRAGGTAGGTGIGLRNIASRLDVRFGAAARCTYGPRAGGGFRAEIVLPLRLRGMGGMSGGTDG